MRTEGMERMEKPIERGDPTTCRLTYNRANMNEHYCILRMNLYSVRYILYLYLHMEVSG